MADNDKTKKTILDLPRIIQIAREHTLLGSYEISLRKYQEALQIIQEREKEISDVNVLKKNWQIARLNIQGEITQTKQMLEACKALTDTDFNYYKRQTEPEDVAKQKFQEKGVMVFDMSNNSRATAGPNTKYFGSAPFSFNDNQEPYNVFQHDEIKGMLSDSVNEDVNEDDEKILNPLKPQPNFGAKKKKKRTNKTTSSIGFPKKNSSKNKPNPWNAHGGGGDIQNGISDDKSMLNPLEQFEISNSNIGGLDTSVNSTVTMDNNTTFMKEIKSFINKNQTNNAQKRKNSTGKMKVGNNTSSNYPIGVGNYSNKNKIINFDKKAANKGALPVIMKKENQKYFDKQPSNLSNKKDTNKETKTKNFSVDLNITNKNDVSGVNMIDEALKKFGSMDNDESSYLDYIKNDKFI